MGKVDPIHYHENNQEFIKHDEYGDGMYTEYVFQIQVPPKRLVIILSLL